MPSVQDLLLALQSDKSPFTSLLEGAARGFSSEYDKRFENAKALLQLQQAQEQKARQEEMDRQIKAQLESQTQAGLKATGGTSAVVPIQKFKRTISQDEKGNYSQKFETVDTPVTNFQSKEYVDANGDTRIGAFNPTTGEITQKPTDSMAPKQPLPLDQQLEIRDKAKITREKPKAQGALQNTMREYDNMIAEADAIKNDPSLGEATGTMSYLPKVAGFGPKRVAARLETLKAKTLLNVLTSLKTLSTNGSSGFGQLSTPEGEAIKNSVSSLDPSMSTEDFKASIDRFKTEMQARKDSLKNTFNDVYGGGGSGSGGWTYIGKVD